MATTTKYLPIIKNLEYPYQGDDYFIRFAIKNTTTGLYVNLTGSVGKCQVKTAQDRDSTLVLEFTWASTSEDLTNGIVLFTASHAVMATVEPGTYFYDVQLTKNLEVKTFLRGTFKVTAEVSV